MQQRACILPMIFPLAFLLTTAIPCGGKDKQKIEPGPIIEVRVFDLAQAPRQVLKDAEWEASRIFHSAGVITRWKAGSPDDDEGHQLEYRSGPLSGRSAPLVCGAISDICKLDIRLLAHTEERKFNALAEALPFARSGIRVNVFYDRVQTVMDKDASGSGAAILGRVLAHEIGHVLLGTNTHSRSGIMRSWWSDEDFGRMTAIPALFDRGDIKRMQERLATWRAASQQKDSRIVLAARNER